MPQRVVELEKLVSYRVIAYERLCSCDNPECLLSIFGTRYSLALFMIGNTATVTWWQSNN